MWNGVCGRVDVWVGWVAMWNGVCGRVDVWVGWMCGSLYASMVPSFMLLCCIQLKYRNQVIIMELCTGGSLYEVIDSPENAYGVSETEFKQVIYDVGELLVYGFDDPLPGIVRDELSVGVLSKHALWREILESVDIFL